MPAIVLVTICVVAALLLASCNLITGPIIAGRQEQAANASLAEVLPNGSGFEKLTIDANYPSAVTAGYKANGGFVFQMSVTGKASGLVILCGIDSEGKVAGTKVLSDNETNEYDANVFPLVEGTDGAYKGMGLSDFEPQLVAKATLTSAAYGEAIKAALQAFAVANGGEVDLRTPEQILQDNCNAALGTTDVKFTKWFATALITGVDAVYESEGDLGRVYVIGEAFIGVNADGTVVTEGVSEENSTAALAANTVISGITLVDVDKPAGTKTNVVSIQKASNGTYVFELLADGYQAMFDYGDGTQIEIKLSIDAEGKILDVLTVSQNESKGLGDTCATEEYYEQYLGKGDADVKVSSKYPTHDGTDLIPDTSTDVGIIASSTYTTVGYQTAIKAAFEAFDLLTASEGGN